MVPEGWKQTTLGAVAQESKKRIEPSASNENLPYVGLEHITRQQNQIGKTGTTSEVTSLKTVFEVGDTLFGKLRPYLHKVAYAHFNGVCSTDILAIRPKGEVSSEFLHRLLSSSRAIVFANASAAGTKMPRTSWKSLAELEVLLPPLPEQQKIAAILHSVDEAIQATQAVIDQTRKVKQCLLQQLLTRGIGHTRFKQTELGEIPEGWEVTTYGSVLKPHMPPLAMKDDEFYGPVIVRRRHCGIEVREQKTGRDILVKNQFKARERF